MNNPKISVLTSVYNSADLLRPAIESILNQTFTDFEWIIINDSTPDNSIEIIESYDDPRIKIIHNKTNLGLAASLNKGLELCKGEYIVRMDTDDVCYQNRLEEQIKFMDANTNISIAGTWVNLTGDKTGVWKTPISHDEILCKLIFSNAIAHPSVIIRNFEFKKYNLKYDEKLRRIQDYDLWVRAAQKLKLANLPKPLLYYRIDDNAKSDDVIKWAKQVMYHIRAFQLSKLDITLTEDENKNIHFITMGALQKVNIKLLANIFSRIIEANNSKKVYSNSYLLKIIGRTWIRLILTKPKAILHINKTLIKAILNSLFE
jgi:glycosyltransferase involved in cell wall biosynthesis